MALPFLFRFVRACPRIILEEVWARGRLDSQSANPVPCAGGSGRRKVLVSQGLGLATKPHCQHMKARGMPIIAPKTRGLSRTPEVFFATGFKILAFFRSFPFATHFVPGNG